MTDNPGRSASALRVVVLLLLAGMCYQLGYSAGFTNGNWETRRQQVWEAAGRAADESADSAAASATAVIDLSDLDALCNLDAESAPNGITLGPPVALPSAPEAAAGRRTESRHALHPLATTSSLDSRF
jgi:hypothetical protein